MGDELDRIVTEGVIVEEAPYTSVQEARADMERGLNFLRDGHQLMAEGRAVLMSAQRRMAWRVLGFDCWQDCLDALTAATYNISVEKASRLALVAQLRTERSMSTEGMAAALGVSSTTVVRDLAEARASGLLDGEPDTVRGLDGRERPTTRRPDAKKPRRSDLRNSWMANVDHLRRRNNSFEDMLADDRFSARRADLAIGTLAEIIRARDLYTRMADLLSDDTGENQ